MMIQHVHPVTLKRAEIKVQSGTVKKVTSYLISDSLDDYNWLFLKGFTPARPEAAGSSSAPGKVGRIRRIESGSEAEQQPEAEGHLPTEGAGGELAQALKKRWLGK